MSPTRTAPASAADIIATADAELQEAEDLVTVLEDRVRDGDDAVQPAELEKARGLFRFAQLRRDAATKKAEAAIQAEARAKYEKVIVENLDAATVDISAQTEALLDDARAKFVEAMELLRAKNRSIYRIANHAQHDVNYRDDRLDGGQAQTFNGNIWFTWDGVTYEIETPADLARRMLNPVRAEAKVIGVGRGFKVEDEL